MLYGIHICLDTKAMEAKIINSPSILIVDDSLLNARLLSHWCAKWGYSFDLAFTGTEALVKALSSNYTLLIMDILLPDMTGVEVVQELAYLKPGVDVVFQSGISEREFKTKGGGAHLFLQKPYYPAQMQEVVDFVFQKHVVKMLA